MRNGASNKALRKAIHSMRVICGHVAIQCCVSPTIAL
jgi:hypothetical protein